MPWFPTSSGECSTSVFHVELDFFVYGHGVEAQDLQLAVPLSVLPVGSNEDCASSVADNFLEDLVHFFEGGHDADQRLGLGGPMLLKGILLLRPVAAESRIGAVREGIH